MRIAILIPTYNEAGVIQTLLGEIYGVLQGTPEHEWHVVVIDGHSPDATAQLVRDAQSRYPSLHLIIEEKKRGLAYAYGTGIQYAKEKLHADAFVEFDGDGQHDPRDIVRLANALGDGADLVIGSRYVPLGSVPSEWAFYRKFLSRYGSIYSRLLLELPVHDITSGLKITRMKEFGENLPYTEDALLTSEYAYKIQFLYDLYRRGARIREIPITFRLREHDMSKSTPRDIIESFRVTALLRFRTLHSWHLLRVAIVGGIGFVLQTSIFEFAGIQFGLVRPSTAALIGGEVAILSNFFLNNRFNFDERTSPLWRRLGRFHAVSLGSITLQWILIRLAEILSSDPMTLRFVYLISIALGFATNYIGYTLFVWNKK